MAFNPPAPTPEVPTSQSSVLERRGRGGGGSALAPPPFFGGGGGGWGLGEPLTKSRTAGFPVRPANTTIDHPVSEFVGSATDLQNNHHLSRFAVQDVKMATLFRRRVLVSLSQSSGAGHSSKGIPQQVRSHL